VKVLAVEVIGDRTAVAGERHRGTTEEEKRDPAVRESPPGDLTNRPTGSHDSVHAAACCSPMLGPAAAA
jgi:hypothetical protein